MNNMQQVKKNGRGELKQAKVQLEVGKTYKDNYGAYAQIKKYENKKVSYLLLNEMKDDRIHDTDEKSFRTRFMHKVGIK